MRKKPRDPKFNKSDKRKVSQASKGLTTNGICEKYGMVGIEIYHKIHLTLNNAGNSDI